MSQKKAQKVFLVIIIFGILISAGVLLYRFPGSYEIIYGAIAAIFGACSLYVSAISYEVSQAAQKDSKRSADATEQATHNAEAIMEDSRLAAKATVESAAAANKALDLTERQFRLAHDITRIENGSHLILQKKEMHYPLLPPQSPDQGTSLIENLDEKRNLKKLRLINTNKGEATNITLTYYLENADAFHRFNIHINYEGQEDRLNKLALEKDLKFPTYELKYFVKGHFRNNNYVPTHRRTIVTLDKYYIAGSRGRKRTVQHGVATKDPRNIAFLELGDDYWFLIPESFHVLCHQFFLERGLLQEKEWKLPTSPLLLVRVEYNEPIYDKLGDLDAYNRVKEFEVTCSSNVKIVQKEGSEEPDPNKNHVLGCHFIIKTRLDKPISRVIAPQEELASERDLGVSTGATEE